MPNDNPWANIAVETRDRVVSLRGNIIKEVTIIDGHKRRQIELEIIGDLGLDFDDEGWNIYHVPTGSNFNAVPSSDGGEEYEYTREQLIEWMKKVQEPSDQCYEFEHHNYTGQSIKKCWAQLRTLTIDNFKSSLPGPKRIIEEWCLSVSVI